MSTKLSQAELFSLFQEFLGSRANGPQKWNPGVPDPMHRGVIDAGFVRPAPSEYPRMMHHASLPSKVVENREEQEALGPQWLTIPVAQRADWRGKALEVRTQSGYRVYTHHHDFLKGQGFEINSLKEAAEFIDRFTEVEQEQFFAEAENQPLPVVEEPEPEKKGRGKGK